MSNVPMFYQVPKVACSRRANCIYCRTQSQSHGVCLFSIHKIKRFTNHPPLQENTEISGNFTRSGDDIITYQITFAFSSLSVADSATYKCIAQEDGVPPATQLSKISVISEYLAGAQKRIFAKSMVMVKQKFTIHL